MASKHTTPQNHRYSVAHLVGALFFLLLLGGCVARKIRDAEYAHKAGRYGEAAEMYRELYRKQTRKDKEKKAFLLFVPQKIIVWHAMRRGPNPFIFRRALISIRIPLCFCDLRRWSNA